VAVDHSPVLTVFVRHSESGKSARNLPEWNCRKWLRYSVNGKPHRVNANTRTWGAVEEKAWDLQEQLERANRGNQSPPDAKWSAIEQAVQTLITAKEEAGARPRTTRNRRFYLRHQSQELRGDLQDAKHDRELHDQLDDICTTRMGRATTRESSAPVSFDSVPSR